MRTGDPLLILLFLAACAGGGAPPPARPGPSAPAAGAAKPPALSCRLEYVEVPAPLPEKVIVDRVLGIDAHPEIEQGPPRRMVQLTVTGFYCPIRELIGAGVSLDGQRASGVSTPNELVQEALLEAMPAPTARIGLSCGPYWAAEEELSLEAARCASPAP
jgi:hypothetical protein